MDFKDTSVSKACIHATGHPLDNLPFKIENLQKFSNSYSQEQTEHVYCHCLLISFIQNCQTQAEAYSEPYQRFKMMFLAKIAVPEAYSQQSQTCKIELFEKKIFSHPLFRSFTIYTKSSILDVRLCSG